MPHRTFFSLALLWAQFPPGARGAPAPCKDETVGLLRPKPLVDVDSAVSFPRAQGGRSNGRISSIDPRSGNVTVRFLENWRLVSGTAHRSELEPPTETDGVPPAKSDNALRREFLSQQLENTLPDEETRHGLLWKKMNLNDEKKMAIAKLIHDGRNNIEDKAIRDLKLGFRQAKALREMNILDSDPFRLHLLMTRPPMARKLVRYNTIVSIPNKNGNLQNASVIKVEGENAHIRIHEEDSAQTTVVPIHDVYRHIETHSDKIILRLNNGLPTAIWVHGDLDADTMGVKPRARTGTATKDLSSPTDPHELASLNEIINELQSTQINSPRFTELNNDWMLRVQSAMRQQGISTSLTRVTRTEPSIEIPIFNLEINGIHPNGNKAARIYMKIAEQQDAHSVTISLYDNIKKDGEAFFDPWDMRVEMGYHAALNILEGLTHPFVFHELRHLMFENNRSAGQNSIFDISFRSASDASKNLSGRNIENSGPYDKYMLYEELYNYISDAFHTSKNLNSLFTTTTIARSKEDQIIPLRRYMAIDAQINHRLQWAESLAENSENVLNDILKSHNDQRILDNVPSMGSDETSIRLWNDSQQEIYIPLPKSALRNPEQTSATTRAMLTQARDLSSELRARAQETRRMSIYNAESGRAKRRALREMLMLVRRANSGFSWEGPRP